VRRAAPARAGHLLRAVIGLAMLWATGTAHAQVPTPSGAAPVRPPQVRAAADSGPALRVAVAADTVLFPSDERLPIAVRSARPMTLLATVTAERQPSVVVWHSDTVPPGTAAALAWDLRTPNGERLPSGRYLLEVTGLDAAGATVRARQALVLTQLAADTQPLPRPLAARELEPETVLVRQTAPWAIFIGAGAGLLPGMIGRRELNDGRRGDPNAWIVVSTVTVAGFVALFAGRHQEFAPENAAHNVQVRQEDAERRAAIREANAQARAVAPYRIQADGGPR
jgi:hypothetical protein